MKREKSPSRPSSGLILVSIALRRACKFFAVLLTVVVCGCAMAIKEGQPAPDFALKDQDGKVVRLSDFKGKPLVLYFYPKDETPGCTAEACTFRDNFEVFSDAGAAVVGVSSDS